MTEVEVYIPDRAAWRRWLSENAAGGQGVWLIYDKGPARRLSADDISEEALCFGWIDSKPRSLSATQAKIYVAPRKKGSSWSRLNKTRVERLTAEGLMDSRGLAVVEAARADGSWNALDLVETLTEPPELTAALDARPDARASWDSFPRSARRAILEWICNARTETTRAKRIQTTVDEAAEGRRANQWRQPKGS